MGRRDDLPVLGLADYYPPRPGYCNFYKGESHQADRVYVVEDRGYFDGYLKICATHVWMKAKIAVWPRPWLANKVYGTRPLPLEMTEQGPTRLE